jgi:predicted double-glycine peptidase
MAAFQLLHRSRQTTEFSCGPAAVQAVLRHWGHDVAEQTLMDLMETNSEVGTHPENIVRGVRSLGLQAELKQNVTLDELQHFTSSGNPVIALGQVWRSGGQGSPTSVADDWESGHYIVVLGVDKDNVYFQDPYLRMCKGFAPRKEFEAHWHQAMGGDLNNPKLIHLAIFITGDEPAEDAGVEAVDLSSLNFSQIGSINLLVTEFPDTFLPFDLMNELRDIWESEIVRPAAFILLRKHKDGGLSAVEGGRLQDEKDIIAFNALLAAIAEQSVSGSLLVRSKAQAAMRVAAKGDFGLSTNDLGKIGERLPPGRTAIVLLVENTWERRFRTGVERYGGRILNQRMIPAETIARVGQAFLQSGDDSPAELGRTNQSSLG